MRRYMLTNGTANISTNFHGKGGKSVPLAYQLIDPTFSQNVTEALEDKRYPFSTQYPWHSADFVLSSISLTTIDDTVNSLNVSDNKKYNIYNVDSSQPGFPVRQNSTCFHTTTSSPCTVSVQLAITPSTLLSSVMRSEHATNLKKILLDEGAIIGGITFFTFFFGIYTIGNAFKGYEPLRHEVL